ncbi:hypothetical protein [Candidatus Chlorohelix sp.]|uniref:class I SAM-dependent methyltransferase n=1 Tax=Candidatus Chlorohelix sp. TaxID=3139201 RepID=UPI0030435F48
MERVVLSHVQVAPLLKLQRDGATETEISPNLSLSKVGVQLTAKGVLFPGGETLSWADAEKISEAENSCYVLSQDGSLSKIEAYSDETNRYCSLLPTRAAPTLLISGILMHRIKDTDPYQDTLSKIKAIEPVTGNVLDTCTGLGYTAIEAAKRAERVTTIEFDPAVQEIEWLNPWSQALFDNPRITRMRGDSSEIVPSFETESFHRVVHDPPTFSLAGQLYSEEFYRQLYRVLKRGGILFHYIGDPKSNYGTRTFKGVIRRLQSAGFKRVVMREAAFGVVAYR